MYPLGTGEVTPPWPPSARRDHSTSYIMRLVVVQPDVISVRGLDSHLLAHLRPASSTLESCRARFPSGVGFLGGPEQPHSCLRHKAGTQCYSVHRLTGKWETGRTTSSTAGEFGNCTQIKGSHSINIGCQSTPQKHHGCPKSDHHQRQPQFHLGCDIDTAQQVHAPASASAPSSTAFASWPRVKLQGRSMD